MDILVETGCGLDVHKETVVACVMGEGVKKGDQNLQRHDKRPAEAEGIA